MCNENNLPLEIEQPEDGVESNCKGLILPVDLFVYEHSALNFLTCCALALNVQSYKYCVKLHAEGR